MKKLSFAVLLGFLFLGCTSEADRIPGEITERPAPALELNEGRKWHTDDETQAGIQNMVTRTKQFTNEADLTNLQAYQELAKELNGELNSLYRNCTITGQAFIELQKLLKPIAEDIDLMQGNDLNAASAAEIRIEARLAQFPAFFE